jgi:hypothetical protein
MKKSMFLIAVLLVSAPLFAADEMKKLDWMVGEWNGAATTQTGAEKHMSHVTERIQWKLGGKALLVEGLGKDGSGAVVHEALAVISYNEAAKKYEFDAWTARYPHTDTWFEVGATTAQWGFDTPQGKVRYSISRTPSGQWIEIGEYSADGTKWMKFFDMTLTKK